MAVITDDLAPSPGRRFSLATAIRRNPTIAFGGILLALLIVMAVFAPLIATHDPAMIDATRQFASARALSPDGFEFQMLYGIRRDLQARLRDAGYRVRVYVPFGREWFPYFMRRLGERPANVAFVIRGLLSERHS